MFMIGALIVAIAATAITIKTLVGYIELRLSLKVIVSLIVIFSWFSPVIIGGLRATSLGNTNIFAYISNIGYFLFGAAFILLVLLLFRDFIWFLIYELAKVFKYAQANVFNPSDYHKLNLANVYTLGLTLILSIYACYEALKVPDVKEVVISSAKLRQKYTIVQLSDIHVNRTTPVAHLQKLVAKVNSLNPDLIVLTGDIGDDKVSKVEAQMAALKGLKSKYGEYIVYGNHELYNGLPAWQFKYLKQGWTALFNSGVRIKGTELYIGGIPDISFVRGARFFKLDLNKTFENAKPKDYKVLLSHSPKFYKDQEFRPNYDLQLSGHTHGGQIFPFHFLVHQVNKYLAGLYEQGTAKIYVSRGAGYWGAPLRLFAPSEITLIKLVPQK